MAKSIVVIAVMAEAPLATEVAVPPEPVPPEPERVAKTNVSAAPFSPSSTLAEMPVASVCAFMALAEAGRSVDDIFAVMAAVLPSAGFRVTVAVSLLKEITPFASIVALATAAAFALSIPIAALSVGADVLIGDPVPATSFRAPVSASIEAATPCAAVPAPEPCAPDPSLIVSTAFWSV